MVRSSGLLNAPLNMEGLGEDLGRLGGKLGGNRSPVTEPDAGAPSKCAAVPSEAEMEGIENVRGILITLKELNLVLDAIDRSKTATGIRKWAALVKAKKQHRSMKGRLDGNSLGVGATPEGTIVIREWMAPLVDMVVDIEHFMECKIQLLEDRLR